MPRGTVYIETHRTSGYLAVERYLSMQEAKAAINEFWAPTPSAIRPCWLTMLSVDEHLMVITTSSYSKHWMANRWNDHDTVLPMD